MRKRKIIALMLTVVLALAVFPFNIGSVFAAEAAQSVAASDADFLIANNTVTVTLDPTVVNAEHSVSNAAYKNSALDEMEWLGFKVNTADSAGHFCMALEESNGARYAPEAKHKQIYLMDKTGKMTEFTSYNSGNYRLWLDGNFDGYVILNIQEFFSTTHTAYPDSDGQLTLSDITAIKLWHLVDSTSDWTVENFVFAKTKSDFAGCFLEMDIYADINADREINVIDLVRFKRYNTDKSISIAKNNADLVFDSAIDALDLAELSKYLLSGAYANDKEGLYFKTLREPDTEFITDGRLYVILDKTMPQALFYKTADGRYIFGAGDITQETLENSYIINGSTYSPANVTFEKTGDSTAQYSVTIKSVALSSSVTSNISFTYRYTVKDGELVKEMLSLTGDDKNIPLSIEETAPVLKVYDTMAGAGIAASSTEFDKNVGYVGEEMIGTLAELSSGDSISDSSFSFVWNDNLAASIYTESAFHNPYTAKVSTQSLGKAGELYAGVYYHRLLGGERVQSEDENGKITDVLYKSVIGFSADCNSTETVDWQDAAVWLRGRIPQMSTALRAYLNQGDWAQTQAAFPQSKATSEEVNNPAIDVRGTYGQYLSRQKNVYNLTDKVGKFAYCMVGWQGRGHDYNWPDLTDQILNPALLGSLDELLEYKEQFADVGGVLSFHINQSDISEGSKAYADHGSEVTVTTGDVVSSFGWNIYPMSHYFDFTGGYATQRQDAFAEEIYAPFIMYSDVMLDTAAYAGTFKGLTAVEEQYAKAREVQHWRALGTNIATENYSQEKYLNGQFLFNFLAFPTVIDQFMTAGNIRIYNSRLSHKFAEEDRGIYTSDYIWGMVSGYLNVEDPYTEASFLYSGDYVSAAKKLAYNVFRGGFVNGMMGSAGILSYKETDTGYETVWNNGISAVYDRETDTVKIWNDGVLVADGDSVFIASPDGEEKILAYTISATTLTRKLPEAFRGYSALSLYRLSEDGRVYIGEVAVQNGEVSFETEAYTSYVLLPNGAKASVKENVMTKVSKAVGTSKNANSYDWYTIYDFRTRGGSKPLSIAKALSPDNDWLTTFNNQLEDYMLDSSGNLLCEYPANPFCTIDGDINTYWEPATNINTDSSPDDGSENDMAANKAYITYNFKSEQKVKYIKITEASEADSEVLDFGIAYWKDGKFNVCYRSTNGIPDTEIDISDYLTDVTDISTTALKLTINTAESNTPRIAEIAVYSK
ncbi:MAG: hypothetical protein IKD04_03375 [Clostridia bacterium]|nr:hypothetical protein [Clostridia bacterium]